VFVIHLSEPRNFGTHFDITYYITNYVHQTTRERQVSYSYNSLPTSLGFVYNFPLF